MKLRTYINQLPKGGKSDYARRVGVSKAMITLLGNGSVPIPKKRIDDFINASDGVVTRSEIISEILGVESQTF